MLKVKKLLSLNLNSCKQLKCYVKDNITTEN